MSLKLQMVQVARLAPNLLRDSTELVVDFVRGQQHPEGGFVDRQGKADLYYTVFGILCLRALRQDLPVDSLARYLRSFGGGEALDLVHLTCLARCWSDLPEAAVEPELRRRVLERLAAHRTPDGGYHADASGRAHGSAYGCFLAVGAHQDVRAELPEAAGIGRCLESLACGDGSYSNDPTLKIGNTPATAAAVTMQRHLQLQLDPRSGDWLLRACHEDGGFFAVPLAPIPDLLSTAVALHALTAMHRPLDPAVRDKCLDFTDTLWTRQGSFYGNWAEESLDVEYTWYGLLALGHLSL